MLVFGLVLFALVTHLDRSASPAVSDDSRAPGGDRRADGTSGPAGTAAPAGRDAGPGTDAEAGGTGAAPGADRSDGDLRGGDTARPGRAAARVRAYVALTNPRLWWLLSLVALAGMGLATATGKPLDGVTVVATLGGGVLAIGAAGTFNHVYERDRDRRMDRTADRPLATRAVPAGRAAAFGIALFVASMATLLAFVNPVAAGLTAAAVGYYAVVYTVLLKPSTPWNTVLGGGAGALPALIGWAAVTGGVGLPAAALAAAVFCWTPAHFYNLAIAYRNDYAAAGFPMLPVVEGVRTTRRRILYWLGAALSAATGLGAVADLGAAYAAVTVCAGAAFLWTVVRGHWRGTRGAAIRGFHASNGFLAAMLVAILLETLLA